MCPTPTHTHTHTHTHRCVLSTDCVPEADNTGFTALPLRSDEAVTIDGRCVPPCAECDAMATDPQCGQDGNTYRNTCFLTCAQIAVSWINIPSVEK